jgi:hypothetical protein
MIIGFAEKARAYGLLKRCLRHAMDSNAIDIWESKVTVARVEGVICLVLEHQVRASMKTDVYDVIACFNMDTISACQCSCKCGSNDDERVLCIHILPAVYQIALLIFDGLGEHLLVELASYISVMNANEMTDENAILMQSAITSLILAVRNQSHPLPRIYRVGTLLRDCCLDSMLELTK